MNKRKNRTEKSAVEELLDFYEKHGRFSTTKLMAENSGLERYLRSHHEGLRGFCERNDISHILNAPKRNTWTKDKAAKVIKKIYDKNKKKVGQSLLTKEGYGGLYQWAGKNFGGYRNFCEVANVLEYTFTTNTWTDALCFRLIKDEFVKNEGKICPEIIKRSKKGAYNYILETHGSFESFVEIFDLQEFVEINNIRYNDDNVKRLLLEAYYKKGDKVYVQWLENNGYHGVSFYLRKAGEGSFIKGAEKFNLKEYVTSRYTDWNNEKALEVVNGMFDQKQSALISADFTKQGYTGLRDWIVTTYGSLEEFFELNNIGERFTNMASIGKELWSYGIRFEKMVKEVFEEVFETVEYNKWVEHLKIRPDFIIGNDGLWVDAKLSSFAYFTDDTVDKYTNHSDCQELWLVYLRGHTFRVDNDKTKVIPITKWYSLLEDRGRKDLIEKIENLREEVSTIEKNASA